MSVETAGQTPRPTRERAALVGLVTRGLRRSAAETSMAELEGLAAAAGATSVLRLLQERPGPDPATYVGRGKLETLGGVCAEMDVDLVIFDNELSPAQLRNLESALDRRVIDRTQLILDIFARRARTREGKLQVELAQLRYLLPRLVGWGTVLSRLGGGIGTRGPGETKLETDRRRIRRRIGALAREIETVRRHRSRLRLRRQKNAIATLTLVGYTNAGKTTLFNRLTGQQAAVSDAPFVTLDPLVRRLRLPGGRDVLVADTVGFVDRLPHTLVAAFRATLEEVADSDVLLHVIDSSSGERDRQVSAVHRVLEEVGAAAVPRLEIYNKIDATGSSVQHRLDVAGTPGVAVSALTGAGLDILLGAIEARLGPAARLAGSSRAE